MDQVLLVVRDDLPALGGTVLDYGHPRILSATLLLIEGGER